MHVKETANERLIRISCWFIVSILGFLFSHLLTPQIQNLLGALNLSSLNKTLAAISFTFVSAIYVYPKVVSFIVRSYLHRRDFKVTALICSFGLLFSPYPLLLLLDGAGRRAFSSINSIIQYDQLIGGSIIVSLLFIGPLFCIGLFGVLNHDIESGI